MPRAADFASAARTELGLQPLASFFSGRFVSFTDGRPDSFLAVIFAETKTQSAGKKFQLSVGFLSAGGNFS